MGGSCVGSRNWERGTFPHRFLEANVKSLIFTIGAPPDLLPLLIVPLRFFKPTRAYGYQIVNSYQI